MSRLHRLAWLGIAVVVAAISGCDTGSKDAAAEYFTVHYTWTQTASGGLVLRGETDLPNGSQIDALLSTDTTADQAVDHAVLIGSTEGGPASRPVRDGVFTIPLDRVLTNTCGVQPPCGPFATGRYLLLIDAKTPDVAPTSVTMFDDPRYLSVTHGVAGFTGIEIADHISLKLIQLCLDADGNQREGGCVKQ